MNDVVKYRNEFNLVGMRDWNKTKMDFLFAVMSKIKEKGTQVNCTPKVGQKKSNF